MADCLRASRTWGLLSLVRWGADFPIRPGFVLNEPPFSVSVIRPLASHNIDANGPFVRSGQRPGDSLTDKSPYRTLARFWSNA